MYLLKWFFPLLCYHLQVSCLSQLFTHWLALHLPAIVKPTEPASGSIHWKVWCWVTEDIRMPVIACFGSFSLEEYPLICEDKILMPALWWPRQAPSFLLSLALSLPSAGQPHSAWEHPGGPGLYKTDSALTWEGWSPKCKAKKRISAANCSFKCLSTFRDTWHFEFPSLSRIWDKN